MHVAEPMLSTEISRAEARARLAAEPGPGLHLPGAPAPPCGASLSFAFGYASRLVVSGRGARARIIKTSKQKYQPQGTYLQGEVKEK